MLGAIGGDIGGSIYEYQAFKGIKCLYKDIVLYSEQCRITDDTILTLAVADAIINKVPYEIKVREYIKKYTDNPRYEENTLFFKLPFSKGTIEWSKETKIGTSNGTGAPMRVSAIPMLFNDFGTMMMETKKAVICTHNSEEAIRGSQAVVAATYLAKKGYNKALIKKYIEKTYNYNLDLNLNQLQINYKFYFNCDNVIPIAIFIFLITNTYEECIKTAISIGGDTDTIACIAGGLSEAYHGIPFDLQNKIKSYLNNEEIKILHQVYRKTN